MPVTRGRARMMESQEDDMDEGQSQMMQEIEEEVEEHDEQTPAAAEAQDEVNLKEMAKQLTNTLKHLLTTHRQLENDAAMIQAGMDELYRMQQDRAQRIVGRLKNASSTILTFGEATQDARRDRPEQDENDCEEEDEEMMQ
uniref:Uncharacterized protein n=1 Tax=Peronospora matthiolae TaxID=2874970 RepID=A0AAV1TR50_9STRA